VINERRTRFVDEDAVNFVVIRIDHEIAYAPHEYTVRRIHFETDQIPRFLKHRYRLTIERLYRLSSKAAQRNDAMIVRNMTMRYVR